MLNIIAGTLSVGVTPSTNSYESIASTTVGSGGQSTITFSSIPSTFTHLQLRIMCKSANTGNTGDYAALTFNSDSGSNYTYHRLKGDGSSASAYGTGTGTFNSVVLERITTSNASIATEVQGVLVVDILDYTNTNKNTTVRNLGGYDNNGSGQILLTSALWTNTNAVTSITIVTPTADNWTQYSSFALYGIKGV